MCTENQSAMDKYRQKEQMRIKKGKNMITAIAIANIVAGILNLAANYSFLDFCVGVGVSIVTFFAVHYLRYLLATLFLIHAIILLNPMLVLIFDNRWSAALLLLIIPMVLDFSIACLSGGLLLSNKMITEYIYDKKDKIANNNAETK